MAIFDKKNWNSEVFQKYMETVPNTKRNALLKAGVLRTRNDLKASLVEGAGGNYISAPMIGRIGGTALNYDGSTNITADDLETFVQGMIVVGRAKAWQEKDFNFDITGHDFMRDIANQVGEYWDGVDQDTILAALAGVFGITAFANAHTLDISATSGADAVDATTLNLAIQKASGDNKNIFSAAILHSAVATNLENLQVLEYFKHNDSNGIQRDVALASWNGRTVLIDDSVPVSGGTYTSYILGANAFDYVDCGAKVPNEVDRDAKAAGGIDYLITRQRKIFHPNGFTFVQPTSGGLIMSPTDTQLSTAARWKVATDTSGNSYPLKAIPIARILSKG